jgi:acylphosphatase
VRIVVEAVRALVRGRVQGVGYRAFALHTAHRLGLRGFARNLPDGRVEVVAVGAADVVESFLGRLAIGPPGSRVDGIDRQPLASPPELDGFEIRG